MTVIALLSSYNQVFREIIEILNKQLFKKEIAFVSRSWKDKNDNEFLICNQIFREIIEILNKQLFQKEIAFVFRSWKDKNDKELPNLPFYASNYDTSEVSLFVLLLVGIFLLLRI